MLLTRQPNININLQDGDGNTPLLLAVKRMDVVTEQLFVESDADTEVGNKGRMLLDWPDGSNINDGGGFYLTALHNAANQGEMKTVEQLVNRGANVNARDGQYHTTLQAAAAAVGGFDDVVEYLLG